MSQPIIFVPASKLTKSPSNVRKTSDPEANDAIEISLSENFFKLTMSPADACRAFQDIIETEKKTPADIARRFGLTERFVLGRLRLNASSLPAPARPRSST